MENQLIDDHQRARIKAIITYWFGESDLNLLSTPEQTKIWWSSSPETDQFITENFKEDLLKLAGGEYEGWKNDKDGKMAIVLLCDQFSRNIFRKKKEAFDYDHIALSIVQSITDEEYQAYSYQERNFLIMPYMHSENIEVHKAGAELLTKFSEYVKHLGEEHVKGVEGRVSFLKKHTDMVEQYGRYPHRNEVLGREDTPEEVEYLKTAPRYGQ